MKKLLIGAIIGLAAAVAIINPLTAPLFHAVAEETVPAVNPNAIHVGASLYDLLIAYVAVIGTIVGGIVSWVQIKIKAKTGIDIDWGHRDAIETFAANQAGRFLNRFESLKGVDISIGSPIIAGLANEALQRIPEALKHFNLGPDDMKQRISDMIGRLTAPAAVTPPPATPTPVSGTV